MESGGRIHLVAVIEGNIIGNIILIKEPYVLYSHRCIIADMIVNPAFQNRGIASELFNQACKFSSELDFDYVTTSCCGNGTEHFYKSLRMKECGRFPNGIYEPWGEYVNIGNSTLAFWTERYRLDLRNLTYGWLFFL